MLIERFPTRTPEDIMEIVGLTTDHLRHTLTAQMLLEEGREEGRQEGQALGEAAVTIRLLNRRCGPLSEATRSRIQTLPLDQLVALSEALLDFSGPDDLAQWLTDPTR